MQEYRLYWHDRVRPAMRTEYFEAQSDEHAIKIARAMDKPVNCELWNLDRLVARISARRVRS